MQKAVQLISRKSFIFASTIALLCGVIGCTPEKKSPETPTSSYYAGIQIPLFNADSAFAYVDRQVAFGPRVPGKESHAKCGDFLKSFMQTYADTIFDQHFASQLYNGEHVMGRNIIASFAPHLNDRILLAAHWDSRLWADQDENPDNHHSPILGANDGASGVGVLMEIARLIKQTPPDIGVDIIFFDIEDQGRPQWDNSTAWDDSQSDWCLGSQYWSKNKHLPYYQAMYGILLDMVGYEKPLFTKEEQSMFFAEGFMNKIWEIASQRGYGNIFVDRRTGGVLDDHVFVNRHAKIPMIDIVQHSDNGGFFPHWHTISDNMDVISPKTLKIVGEVVLTAIYSEKR